MELPKVLADGATTTIGDKALPLKHHGDVSTPGGIPREPILIVAVPSMTLRVPALQDRGSSEWQLKLPEDQHSELSLSAKGVPAAGHS